MAFDKPQSRNEAILQNMLGANNELEPPKSRVEALLQDIAGQMPEANPSEGTTTGTLERLKIGDDIYSVEGGGSGTSDYDALNNKPQIAGTTLSGDKSLADLGIASASAVSGILDGTDIDSFGDVETALDDKVDKINGKGLSTNDYDDTEKAAVAAATTAIAGIKDGTAIDSFGDVETALGAIQDGQSIDSFADVESALSDVDTAINGIKDGTDIDSFADVESALSDVDDDVDSLKSGLTTLDNEVNGDATTYPYADVITIEDAIPSNLAACNVRIEPDQDLHGQSAPYVGGAGKNKLRLTLDALKTLNTSGTWNDNVYSYNDIDYTVTEDSDGNVVGIKVNGTTSSQSFLMLDNLSDMIGNTVIMNGCPTGGVSSYTASGYCLFTGGSGVPQVYDTGSGVEFTVSSYGAQIILNVNNTSVSNLMFYPMIRLSTETDATFAPYTNICPISGHTEVDVDRDGKNLAFKKISGYTINANGVIEALASYNIFVGRVKKGQTYTVTKSSDYEVYAFYTTEPSAGSTSYDGSRVALQEEADYYTIIAPIDGYIAFRTNVGFDNGQLELGSAATPYVPYSGKTYTIALGDTIYGGTVRIDSNGNTVMDVGRKYYSISSTSDFRNNQQGFPSSTYIIDTYPVGKYNGNIVSNQYVQIESGGISGVYISSTGKIRINTNGSYESKDDAFNNELDGAQFCYELAEPLTVQLTPQQIQLLQGQNTLTASTGQISVTVNGVSGSIGAVQTQANATDEALAELAEKLPTAPTTDGAYVLTVTVADGTPTYSWESAT